MLDETDRFILRFLDREGLPGGRARELREIWQHVDLAIPDLAARLRKLRDRWYVQEVATPAGTDRYLYAITEAGRQYLCGQG